MEEMARRSVILTASAPISMPLGLILPSPAEEACTACTRRLINVLCWE